MEFGTIEREIHIDAAPEIVFQVVSSPEHLQEWWPDEARYEPVPGSAGEIVFGDPQAGVVAEIAVRHDLRDEQRARATA